MGPPLTSLPTLLLITMMMVLRWSTTDGSTVISDPGSLRVVGTLSPLHETLLGYQPPLSAILVPLSPVLGPSRFYVAASQLVPSNPAPVDSQTSTTTTPTPLPRAPPGPPRRLFSQSPAASEANFPSSAASSRDSVSDEEKEESAVEQIAAYSKPVSIPSSGRAHFSTMNVADGSYHFGYDTGSGQHQSYREERRFPGGRVEGRYGYVDPSGVLHIVEYTADQRGYRSRVSTRNLNSGNIPIIGPIPAPLIARARSNAGSR